MNEEFDENEMPQWAKELKQQIDELAIRLGLQDEMDKAKTDFSRFKERHGLAEKDKEQTPDNKDVRFKDLRKRLGLDD